MKKFKKFSAMVLALAMCCAPNFMALANDTINDTSVFVDEETIPTDPTEKIVEAEPYGYIELNQKPTQTEYAIGEELDLTGLEVSLMYSGGGEMYESELDDYEVIYNNVNPLDYPDIFVVDTSEFDSSKAGTYKITIEGTEETKGEYWCFGEEFFEVTVTEDADEPYPPGVIESIEWIPTSFDEALTFINTYGRTFVKDGLICTVRDRRISKERFETNVSGDYSLVSSQVYEWMPDLSGYDEDMMVDVMQCDFTLEVNVYMPTAPTNISISWADYYLNSTGEEKPSENSDVTFEFEVAENGEITQTDIYGWMPDCVTEYESFVEKNGNVLTKDGYIGFVSDVSYSSGYSLFFEQSGNGTVEQVEEYCFYLYEAPIEAPGSANYKVEIYKPTTAGNVALEWTTAQEWDYDETATSICTKQLVINDDLTISNVEAKGDVDGDGIFAVSDAVVFNKYLVNKGSLFAADNADLNGDNKINIFDWCIFKRMIVEEMSVSTCEGMPTIIDETLTITDEQKEQLWSETARLYPNTDLSNFKYVYNQNHKLNSYLNYCFDIYYKDIQLHGYGDINTDSNAYAAIDDRIIIQFLCEPSELENISLTPNEDVKTQLKEKYTNSDYETELIIYFDYRYELEIPIRLAYVVYGDYWEDIYDAVTGEKIDTIFYVVP